MERTGKEQQSRRVCQVEMCGYTLQHYILFSSFRCGTENWAMLPLGISEEEWYKAWWWLKLLVGWIFGCDSCTAYQSEKETKRADSNLWRFLLTYTSIFLASDCKNNSCVDLISASPFCFSTFILFDFNLLFGSCSISRWVGRERCRWRWWWVSHRGSCRCINEHARAKLPPTSQSPLLL